MLERILSINYAIYEVHATITSEFGAPASYTLCLFDALTSPFERCYMSLEHIIVQMKMHVRWSRVCAVLHKLRSYFKSHETFVVGTHRCMCLYE